MKSRLMQKFVLAVASVLLFQGVHAMANDPQAPPPDNLPGHRHIIDRMQQVQQGLDELKAKLNLSPGQNEAWSTWSSGVAKAARQQFERMDAWHEKRQALRSQTPEGTTPERMAHRIEQLRERTAFMQENLIRLEAAQARTRVFYDQLDVNQKTIFDLYAQQISKKFMHRGQNCGPNGMHRGPREGF